MNSHRFIEEENAMLKERIRVLEHSLQVLSVASCECLTKTPDAKYHDVKCRYRIIREALSSVEK